MKRVSMMIGVLSGEREMVRTKLGHRLELKASLQLVREYRGGSLRVSLWNGDAMKRRQKTCISHSQIDDTKVVPRLPATRRIFPDASHCLCVHDLRSVCLFDHV